MAKRKWKFGPGPSPDEDDHESKESESPGKGLSPEEWEEVVSLLDPCRRTRKTGSPPEERPINLSSLYTKWTGDSPPEKGLALPSLGSGDRLPSKSKESPPDKSISPHVTPEKAEVIQHRFLSFNPFEGVDTDLSLEEEARPLKEVTTLNRLAGHFAQRTGEIKSLLNKAEAHPAEEQSYSREAAVLACATLQEVLDAQYLREGVKLLARTRNHYLNEVVSVLTYIEDFFEIEKRLLVELDVSSDLATEIIADCRKVFEDVRNGQAPRGQVFEAITRVTDATCDLAKRLREQAIQKRESERTKKILKTASKAIGGTAVVALNVGILATPGTQAFAAFSGILGAGLIEAAAQDL